ncbi:MAG: hypothetical protein ABWX96_05760 [Propionibacteriaceae bacterium]
MPTRLEFTTSDVARTRIGPPLGAFGETVQALARVAFRQRSVGGPGGGAQIEQPVSDADQATASFLWLTPTVGFDLFTIMPPTRTIGEGKDALLSVYRDVFAAEAEFWALIRTNARQHGLLHPTKHPSPVATSGLRTGRTDSRRILTDEVVAFYQHAVAKRWPAIEECVGAERVRLMQCLATGGVEALWQALGDGVRWTGSALELMRAGATAGYVNQQHLGGRGLVVVPSFFACEPAAYFPEAPSAPVMLIVGCPAANAVGSASSAPDKGALLGTTRTAVMEVIARGPHTTTELGQALGIAISGASQHTSVLRRSGLVHSARDGGKVLHSLTDLGRRLLDQLN